MQSMSESLFVIYQTGFYGHGVHAITNSYEQALWLSKLATISESDGQHIFHIFAIPLNQRAPKNINKNDESNAFIGRDFGWMDQDPIYSIALNEKRTYQDPAHPYRTPVTYLENLLPLCNAKEIAELKDAARTSMHTFNHGTNDACTGISFERASELYFIVFKRGAYGHGVHGITTSIQEACQMADAISSRDRDDFHSYDVFTIPLGLLPLPSEMYAVDFGWMNKDPLYSVTKSGQIERARQRTLRHIQSAPKTWTLERALSPKESLFMEPKVSLSTCKSSG